MKKKVMLLFLCMMVILSACGKTEEKKTEEKDPVANVVEENITTEIVQVQEEQTPTTENEETGAVENEVESTPETGAVENEVESIPETGAVENEVESIQDEIAKIEEKSREHCNIDTSSMGQQEMNRHSAEWYMMWDEELNSLWSRLSDELDADTKARVLEEQRAWIKKKEGNVTAAGIQALGGTLQPLLESDTAGEMTRARVYILAGYLAEARNESFTISPEIQESLDAAEISLDELFKQVEGQWIFDEARGACVGIERTETCDYGVEGSNWTIWVTGGDIFSDLDVYGYTETNILFKVKYEDSDAFYELSFGENLPLILTYKTSLTVEAINDEEVIVCN